MSEDENRRRANEAMRRRLHEQNNRGGAGGHVVDKQGRPIGRPGETLTTRQIEQAAESLSTRTERQSREERYRSTPSVRPAVNLEKIRESLNPEAIREDVLKMDKDEHRGEE